MTATSDLLTFASAPHTLPPQVRADAIRLLADTLAVGAAGATAPGADAILTTARNFGSGGDARLLGTDERLPAASAAFVNGFRIHCLEWDAVHEPAVVHAMSVVTAALGTAIDRRGGCDPDEALTALAVGVDVACGLGIAADSPLTFFRPATAGLIGAALAVARVEKASMADTLGLAYSQCAGTMQAHVEGSVALPFQIANAARAAIVAADLAKAGLTGPHDALEGPFGYFKLFDKGDLSRYTRDLGKVWRVSEISTKPFPCGRASHGVLAALQSLRHPSESWDPSSDEIPAFAGKTTLVAHVPPLIARLVGRPVADDMAPAYARLCLPFLTALMIRDGRIDPRRFTAEDFANPRLREIAATIVIKVDDNPDSNALSPQRLVINGNTIGIPHTLGSPEAALSPEQVTAKRALCEALAGTIADRRLFDDPLAYFTKPIQTPFVPSEVEASPRQGPLDFARRERKTGAMEPQ
jgi:2-methylcitrate dehydratase PrpD